MKLGVRVHDFGRSTAEDLAVRARNTGFECVQLVLHKAIAGESGEEGTLSKVKARNIASAFSQHGIGIAMLGAYFNPVHSNRAKVRAAVRKFKEHLTYAGDFRCQYVGTETGSYNDDEWTFHPSNLSGQAFSRVRTVMADLQEEAARNDAYVAVEGAYGHVMNHPARLKMLLDDIDQDHIRVIVDVFNYLNIDNHHLHREIFDQCLELFKDKIVVFHLKDYVVKDGRLVNVALGEGLMDYHHIIPIIRRYCPDAYCIFEEIRPDQMQASLDFINQFR